MSNSEIKPTAVYIYCRVSSVRQSTEGSSLDEQKNRCSTYAAERKWDVEKVITEAGSAFHTKLPKLDDLISEAKDGSVILVTTYDRFSRNVLDGVTALDELNKRKIRVISVQESSNTLTPAGRYAFQIQVASGEFNSANSGSKIRSTFKRLRDDGNFIGPAAFGFDIEHKVSDDGRTRKRQRVVNENEYAIVRLIEGLRDGISSVEATKFLYKVIPVKNRAPISFFSKCGEISRVDPNALSFNEIANLLNEYEVPFRNGKVWNSGAVARVYKNNSRDISDGMSRI